MQKGGGGSRSGVEAYVNKLLLALVFRSAGLVLEDDVVVPPALHVEVLLIEQWVSEGDASFALVLFGLGLFCFLRTVSLRDLPIRVDMFVSRRTSRFFFSSRSLRTRSSSRCSSASESSSLSSSESSSLSASASLLSSASIARDSANILLLFASASSLLSPAADGNDLFTPPGTLASSSSSSSLGASTPPSTLALEKWADSAARSSAARSRSGASSASPPWPAWRNLSWVWAGRRRWW